MLHVTPVSATTLAGAWRTSLTGWILGVAWILGASIATAADAPPLILEHLTASDGLPQATVMATVQDSQGFVWIATEDGLVRFDGHELYRYAYSRTERDSLPGNFIYDIVEDANHDLWIAVKDSGLARWNRASDNFTVYRHDPANLASLASDNVRSVFVDARGLVWIGTNDAGLDILDPRSGRFEHLRHDAGNAASLSSDRIFRVSPTRAGGIWIATDAGLDKWLPDQRGIIHFGASLRGKEVSQVLEENSGVVWVGGFDSGLTRLDRDGRVLESFRHDEHRADSLKNDDVRAILEDRTGRLWVGTHDGLDLLDRASGSFSHYVHDANDADSLRDSYIMSMYQDQTGLVWIGTRGGGVSRWNPRSWELGAHRPVWLGSEPVNAFADAPDNRVWIASFGAGLVQFDADKGEMTTLDTLLGRHDALGGAVVMSLRHDRQGSLWIGTMANGLKKLAADGRIESVAVKPGDPRATSAAGIMAITETRNGQIWIGTFGGGANVLDPATGIIRQLPFGPVPGAISAPNVTSIAEDANGNLWIGTDGGGLNLARADGTVIKVFQHDPHDATTFPANSIYAITVDAQGRVWAGTDQGGLVRAVGSADSPDSIRFEVVGRAEGLSDTLYGIVPDAAGDLWLSGNAGLMRFNPQTRAIKTYHREHGLQGEEFAFGAYFRLRDGRLSFGGPGGFNIFNPASLTENQQPPRLALTSVSVLGVRQQSAKPFWLLDRIDLDYRGSIVSLDFGVLDFGSPKHNRLAYRMPGLTDQWIDLGAQRRITLTNLDAGDHVLEVRASSPDSVWSPKPLAVSIHRDAAPWRSRWAYAAYALLALCLVLDRVRRQRRKFQEMAQARERLESEVQLRTRELVDSNRQLEEAARAKSNFLDRMSHELRTPMNGVVGMTELLSRTALSATQTHLTKTIRSSAQILLQIVNDLLDLSKIRAGKVTLEALPIDLGQVLEECTSLFAGSAEGKGIELIVCPPARTAHALLGDPLRVRQILMNLVGNAVKFTSQGEVVVRADIESVAADQAIVRISVADTGIGMDATAINRIFEPFSQADETTTRRFGGTGLGLSICKELADLMQGRITVESKPQIGSTFSLSLPLKVGTATPLVESPQLPSRGVRILTRRPALEEALSRHVSSLGMAVVAHDESYDATVLDASSHRDELKFMLAAGQPSQPVIVIATAAEVEALSLRVLIDEKMIILKPVHRIAFQEALAAATGVQLTSAHTARSASSDAFRVKGHVLLVEDEPVNAAVAEGYLAALGCTSAWVKNGTDAVARSATERFDLIFMDLNMPDMDGFAATALIRRREAKGRRVPIIALTAHDAVIYREKCLRADMDDILSKPYVLEDCTRLLRRWLTRGNAADENEVSASHADVPSATTVGALTSIDAGAVSALRNLRADRHGDLYAKLVELYRAGSVDSLVKLRAAFVSMDLRAAAAVCHKFAAAAANVGALEYAKQIRLLEQLCIEGDSAKALGLHDTLQTVHAALLEALHGFTLKASA
jgi:signal transduction histidine kinase/ligand-binding sensor domain-containing protein/CheY-like chemotaxis protein/HPt (histidine-containing phosphotransfer) domain-containing protein